MSHCPEPAPSESQHKRKRDPDDNGQHSDRIPQPPPPQSGNGAAINYLSRVDSTRLKLIQGDGEGFSDVLTLINDYEAVLSRQESLAANLGAKLTGPRLVKAMEGLFEGSITVSPRDPYVPTAAPMTWLDILQFAKSNPNDFNLSATPDRGRCCQFFLKGVHVEITEDDWRLIMSGALDRFCLAPPHPLEEDENSELATVEILEQRLQMLIKKADEVARKARQLNYHLSGRKAAINSRRTQSPTHQTSGFHAVNAPPSTRATPGYDLHTDLLQQFTAALSQPQPSSARVPTQTLVSLPTTPVVQQGPATSVSGATRAPQQTLVQNSGPSPSAAQDPAPSQSEDKFAVHRPLITAHIEKLLRGDFMYPPCDRCRRLKIQCVKHLTACQGCTKKHAKCNWKAITDEEIAWLKDEMGGGEGDGEVPAGGGYTPDPPPTASVFAPAGYGEGPSSLSLVDTRQFAAKPGAAASATIRRPESASLPEPMEVEHIHAGSGGFGTAPVSDVRGKARDTIDFSSRLRDTHQQLPSVSTSREVSLGDHWRLSHMASVATAAAEAREAQTRALSRGSSAGRD